MINIYIHIRNVRFGYFYWLSGFYIFTSDQNKIEHAKEVSL